ncbi:EthD domain-containing protein [Georgenia sp. SYP-B2076]|uniref:EthD domain-containing protein n=1 Tax=Georgenia sp. SYP-B2076 TaxID=2495881 RepID=UPI000F8DB504|nr:EthD domain-containing protein [Georgenia sp. SYP-B2076]
MADGPYLAFEVYRWAGTTYEEFRTHYKDVHAQIGKKIPGLVWYETFMNNNAQEGWPVIGGAPKPDALVVMQFDSEESKQNIGNSPAWLEAAEDDIGFCSHFEIFDVERFTWIPEASPREPHREEAAVGVE